MAITSRFVLRKLTSVGLRRLVWLVVLTGPVGTAAAQPAAIATAKSAVERAYLQASPAQRQNLVEEIGERGARRFAQSQGWQSVLDGSRRAIRQGPDMVYRSDDGVLHVIEAKGGTSSLNRGFGFRQGTAEWAVKSADHVLHHKSASPAEKAAARRILEAARSRSLRVHVVRTPHVLGRSAAPVLEKTVSCTDEAVELAGKMLRSGNFSAGTGAAARTSKLGKAAMRGVPAAVVGLEGVIVAKRAVEVEQQYRRGEISSNARAVEHCKNAAGSVGRVGGAVGGAWAATSAAAPLAAMAGPGAPYVGGAAALTGAVAGCVGGEAAAEATIEWASNNAQATGRAVGSAARATWRGAGRGCRVVGNGAGAAWRFVRGK